MQINMEFPGGARVDARFDCFTVHTDQPAPSGLGAAPTPFATFLASIATCAGIYVLGFCRQRGIPADGIQIVQRTDQDPETGLVAKIYLDIHLPPEFPLKYQAAVIRAADQCLAKKHLEHPPQVEVNAVTGEAAPA